MLRNLVEKKRARKKNTGTCRYKCRPPNHPHLLVVSEGGKGKVEQRWVYMAGEIYREREMAQMSFRKKKNKRIRVVGAASLQSLSLSKEYASDGGDEMVLLLGICGSMPCCMHA